MRSWRNQSVDIVTHLNEDSRKKGKEYLQKSGPDRERQRKRSDEKVVVVVDRKEKSEEECVVIHTEQHEEEVIQAGQTVNLPDLFFTESKDYLIKYNGQRARCLLFCL